MAVPSRGHAHHPLHLVASQTLAELDSLERRARERPRRRAAMPLLLRRMLPLPLVPQPAPSEPMPAPRAAKSGNGGGDGDGGGTPRATSAAPRQSVAQDLERAFGGGSWRAALNRQVTTTLMCSLLPAACCLFLPTSYDEYFSAEVLTCCANTPRSMAGSAPRRQGGQGSGASAVACPREHYQRRCRR